MTAGLFAQHGVFFGKCAGPSSRNPKGYFENFWLKQIYESKAKFVDFDRKWKSQLKSEGWSGNEMWGAKCGAERWDQYWHQVPDIEAIVCCYRPQAQIEASRKTAGFNPNRQTVERNWGIMSDLKKRGPPCFDVWTDQMVKGDYTALLPIFDKLNMRFEKAIADNWVEPKFWRHGDAA